MMNERRPKTASRSFFKKYKGVYSKIYIRNSRTKAKSTNDLKICGQASKFHSLDYGKCPYITNWWIPKFHISNSLSSDLSFSKVILLFLTRVQYMEETPCLWQCIFHIMINLKQAKN